MQEQTNVSISYAITVCNEAVEIDDLLRILQEVKTEQDEIIIVSDKGNTTEAVLNVLKMYESIVDKHEEHELNKDFASHKNFLFSLCTKDYILNLDADEFIYQDTIKVLKDVIIQNPNIDVFHLPRINLVDGLTEEHMKRWGWHMNENAWINFPDYQMRLVKNVDGIRWINKVHEKIVGYKTYGHLPAEEMFCIHHYKSIEKQEQQNNFYDTI